MNQAQADASRLFTTSSMLFISLKNSDNNTTYSFDNLNQLLANIVILVLSQIFATVFIILLIIILTNQKRALTKSQNAFFCC
jgi:hypothetical protein